MLDASAMVAFILAEAGHEAVASCPRTRPRACTVNLSEAMTALVRRGFLPEDAAGLLGAVPLELVDFDLDLAIRAGALIRHTKPFGLSFGDRACLAAALRFGDAAVTGDRTWRELAPVLGVSVELIRHAA